MGNLSALMAHPKFLSAEESTRRYMLAGAGVPNAESDPIETVMARADAMRQGQEASESSVLQTHAAQQPGPSWPTRLMTGALEMEKHAAPSQIGSVLGGVVGPFIPGVSALPPQAHQGLGAMAGEGLAQAVGLNPPSLEQILMAGVSPLPAKALGRMAPATVDIPKATMSKAVRWIPGSSAAIAEQASEEIRALPGMIRGTTAAQLGGDTVDSLFDAAKQSGARVGTDNLEQTVQRLAAEELKAAKGGTDFGGVYKGLLNALQDTIKASPEQALEDIDIWRRRIGAMIGKTSDLNKEQKGFLESIYGSMMRDFEDAATQGVQGADQLLTAVKAARREFAADDLSRLIEKVGFLQPRPDGIPNPRTGAMLQELNAIDRGDPSRSMRLFKDSLDPKEFAEIKDLMQFWHERSVALTPPKGMNYGSGRRVGLAGTAMALTGDPQLAGAAVMADAALTNLLMTKTGRTALRDLISKDQPINITELIALAGGQIARQPLGANPAETVQRLYQGMRAPGETRLEAVPK